MTTRSPAIGIGHAADCDNRTMLVRIDHQKHNDDTYNNNMLARVTCTQTQSIRARGLRARHVQVYGRKLLRRLCSCVRSKGDRRPSPTRRLFLRLPNGYTAQRTNKTPW